MARLSIKNHHEKLPVVVPVANDSCPQLYEQHPVLLGYDVVQYHFIPSYHEGGQPVRGRPEFAYNFQGYQFWFATHQNRQRFAQDPWRYAPAWGGFCSWGVARELEPEWPWKRNQLGPPAGPTDGWLIVNNNTLIFNIWADYSDRFARDLEANMRRAEERWKGWFGELHAGPFNTHCIGKGEFKNWCTKGPYEAPWLKPLPPCNSTTTSRPFHTEPMESHFRVLLSVLFLGALLISALFFGRCRGRKRKPYAPVMDDERPDEQED